MSAGVHIGISFEGEPEVNRRLLVVSDRALHAKPAFGRMMGQLDRAVRGQWRSKGVRGGTPWPALAASTLKMRRAKGVRHRRILEVTGRLMDAVKGKLPGGDRIRIVEDHQLVWGQTVPYAKYHQSRKPRTKLPRRPFLALTKIDKERLVSVLRFWIVRGRLK